MRLRLESWRQLWVSDPDHLLQLRLLGPHLSEGDSKLLLRGSRSRSCNRWELNLRENARRQAAIGQKGTDALLAGKNRHGDLTHLFNTSASVTDTKVFDPFGEVAAKTGSTDPTLGFQSDFTDPVSERVWMHPGRWYGPNEAQFLSRDTVFGQLKTPITLNRYTYANGDPLNYFDPDGREAFKVNDIFCGLGSIFGGKKSSKKSPIFWSFRV